MRFHGKSPRSANASETAGFRCAPETAPMKRMIAMTMSPGATTAAARLIWPLPCRMPPPAATSTSRNVPSSSENSLRHSRRGSSNSRLAAELERQQAPAAGAQQAQAWTLAGRDIFIGHRRSRLLQHEWWTGASELPAPNDRWSDSHRSAIRCNRGRAVNPDRKTTDCLQQSLAVTAVGPASGAPCGS